MSNHQYQPITKPLGYRIQELMQSLQVVGDSLKGVRQGKLYNIVPLYGQLRALLSPKSKGNSPLLLDIAKDMGITLQLYCTEEAGGLPDALKKGLVLHLSGFPATVEQEFPIQRPITLEEFLEYDIVVFNERPYRTKDIIGFFANKAGGAHYSPDLPEDLAQLLSIGLNGQPVLVNALLQIAEVTYKLGVKLLKSQADFEIHLLVFVPHQELKEAAYIFDNQYPDTPMRVFCRLEPGMRFRFGVIGIQGISAVASVNRLIDWPGPHHFTLSMTIKDDLSTNLGINMDGEDISILDVPHPIFVVNDPLDYGSYQNRSYEDENAGLDFGFIEMAMYGRDLLPREKAQLFIYFDDQISKEDKHCIFFRRGQYGHAPPGTKDLTMTGSPRYWSISKLVRNEFPEGAHTS